MEKIEKILNEVCKRNNVGLYDFEMKQTTKGKIFVVYITRIGGATVEDCTNVSRDLDRILEKENLIEGSYKLEVSSPGLERKLRQKRHYLSAINEKIKVTFFNEEKSVTLQGILKEVFPDYLKLELENNKEAEIDFSAIKKAKTYFEFNRKEQK